MGLDSVEIVLDVEDAFQIDISDEEARKVFTVGELYNLILSKIDVQEQNRKQDVWELLCKIVVRILGVKPELVTPEARFVQDLRMD